MKALPINELYPCVQGEGSLTGIPHILIRFSGCRLRCQFANSICDTWYSSWKPEKGSISVDDLIGMYEKFPHIKHTMISGGGPTLQKRALPKVIEIAKRFSQHITLETEGSEYIQNLGIDLLSLSPKLQSSTPRVGEYISALKRKVTVRDWNQHEKWRTNYSDMQLLIQDAVDYQVKPVICTEKDLLEVKSIQGILNVPNSKVWLMPEGATNEELAKKRLWLEKICIEEGYNYCERLHVIIHGDKRGV